MPLRRLSRSSSRFPVEPPHIVNSIMCRPERYERMVPMTAEYNADFRGPDVGSRWPAARRKTNAPPCVWNCSTSPMKPASPTRKSGVDGIVTPVNIQQPQAISLMEFQKMIPDMAPGAQQHLRPVQHLQRTARSPASDPEPDLHRHADEVRHGIHHHRSPPMSSRPPSARASVRTSWI